MQSHLDDLETNLQKIDRNVEQGVSELEKIIAEFDSEKNSKHLRLADLALLRRRYDLYVYAIKVWNLLPKLVHSIKQGDPCLQAACIHLLSSVAEKHPERITVSVEQAVVLRLKHDYISYSAISFVSTYAIQRPERVLIYEEDIIKYYRTHSADIIAASVLVRIAVGKKRQKIYLKMFIVSLTSHHSNNIRLGLLCCIRDIGLKSPQLLVRHKSYFLIFRQQNHLREMCESLIFLADNGKLPDGQKSNQSEVFDENNNVRQHLESKIWKGIADEDGFGEQLEVNWNKSSDTEKMVLNYAPHWSHDLSKLYNSANGRGQLLKELAENLGYTHDDIKLLLKQSEPFLNMLEHFFNSRNSREGTAVLRKSLDDMKQHEAVKIIDDSIKAVEQCISGDFSESSRLPQIFISYQWDHQKQVKALRKYLGLTGFASWMDIERMGGGDELYEKIDSGIRAAKVLICCVSKKYTKSRNCDTELNLAWALKKPIIPLLMENLEWPPEGGAGLMLSKLLYIEFHGGDKETTRSPDGEKYWADEKFDELLQRLRRHLSPELAAVPKDSPYDNWTQPSQELKPLSKAGVANAQESFNAPKSLEEMLAHQIDVKPEIYISYHSDMKKDIKTLYKRLTEEEFTCWLDILEMGGGDSINEKTRSAIKNCKVVVAWVSENYFKSYTCRNDVRLAVQYNRKIVPAFLIGASAVGNCVEGSFLRRAKYVDFTDDVGVIWESEQFDELIDKLNEICHPEKSSRRTARARKDSSRSGTNQRESTFISNTTERISDIKLTESSRFESSERIQSIVIQGSDLSGKDKGEKNNRKEATERKEEKEEKLSRSESPAPTVCSRICVIL